MKVNKKELADVLGVSERTLTEWQRDPSFPVVLATGRGSPNAYETASVIQWMLDRSARAGAKESSRERLERIKGDREEIALAADVGQLVPKEEIESVLESLVVSVRATLLNGDTTLKTKIDSLYGVDVDIDLLNEHSREVLTKLSAYEPDVAPGGEGFSEEICTTTEDING